MQSNFSCEQRFYRKTKNILLTWGSNSMYWSMPLSVRVLVWKDNRWKRDHLVIAFSDQLPCCHGRMESETYSCAATQHLHEDVWTWRSTANPCFYLLDFSEEDTYNTFTHQCTNLHQIHRPLNTTFDLRVVQRNTMTYIFWDSSRTIYLSISVLDTILSKKKNGWTRHDF